MKTYTPCNPQASPEARAVLQYLYELRGNGVITGQHTQTTAQEELKGIADITGGAAPALCGFELLAYSPNINYAESDEECLLEVEENKNTLEQAWKWAERKGLITFTWHWFSPLYGAGKAFYQEKTAFDARRVLENGTPEREAFVHDLDVMAGLLKPFAEKRVPILWRPFHEAEGKWFWWGSKGPETARGLYRMMFDRFVNRHGLHNLIWVWNSPLKEGYAGDDVCDVISRDVYLKAHNHSDYAEQYAELKEITTADKIAALGETGPLPSLEKLSQTHIPWTWFMTWSKSVFHDMTSPGELRAAYQSEYAVTLDTLPKLY
ncbi:MAG: glycoside hydrolase family 26 protein [Oscillospiraceae bacterium]|jgi:mannan endo-1,4-beta-mannosidase|nr:glycoside hydrolase family 26 protein [Oscillospiraceae bacterium]